MDSEPITLQGVPIPENVADLGVSIESVAKDFAGTVKPTPNMPVLFQYDETSESIDQAKKHATEASTLIKSVISGSVNINQEAQNRLRSCGEDIDVAVGALTDASTCLLQALVASAVDPTHPSDQTPTTPSSS